MNKWEPQTPEDRLLLAYWEKTGKGRMFLEVPVGNYASGFFPKGSSVRNIDGVRILSEDSQKDEIIPRRAYRWRDLIDAFRDKEVEVIEAKKRLNRLLFGQAVAGVDMFERQYPAWIVHPVVIYEINDPAMEWVCQKHGVKMCQPYALTDEVDG